MENNSSLAPVLLVVGPVFLAPLILSRFKRLRLPVVVGEIIAGMISGRSGLHLVESDPTLEVLAAWASPFSCSSPAPRSASPCWRRAHATADPTRAIRSCWGW